MALWKQFEEFLLDWEIAGFKTFTCADVAGFLGIETADASSMIQAYQDAMRSLTTETAYVITREGRTTTAIWHFSDKPNVKHARLVTRQFADDSQLRVQAHLQPLLDLIAAKGDARARRHATNAVLRIGRLIQQLEDLASSK